MAKRYIRINWQNAPSTATPRNAENLNKMDKGIDDLDNAVDALETSVSQLNDNLAALITPNTYIGDGTSFKFINLGFIPRAVFISRLYINTSFDKTLVPIMCIKGHSIYDLGNSSANVLSINNADPGFYVYPPTTNIVGELYVYIAVK